MEYNGEAPEQVGGEATGIRIFLQSRRPVIVALWCRDVGGYPPHVTGPGGFPIPCGVATDEASDTSEVVQEMGVHLVRGG